MRLLPDHKDKDKNSLHAAQLKSVTTSLLDAITPSEVARIIVEKGGIEFLEAIAGMVLLLTADGTEIRPFFSQGYTEEQLNHWARFPINAALPVTEVVRTGRPIYMSSRKDLEISYASSGMIDTISPSGRSWAAVPLCLNGSVMGALCLTFGKQHSFDASERDSIHLLADQCTLALDRVRLLTREDYTEEWYRNLFEAHPQPMWVFDDETLAILDVNEAAISHYGYTKIEFLSMTIADLRPAEDLPKLRAAIDARRNGAPATTGIWRHRKLDGAIINVEVFAKTIDYKGHLARVVSIVDVTERVAAERARQESQEQITDLLRERTRLLRQQEVLLAQQKAFLKDVLLTMTGGVLHLCETEADLPEPLPESDTNSPISISSPTLSAFRECVTNATKACAFTDEQSYGLLMAAGEATINVVAHASSKSGTGRIRYDAQSGTVQAWIVDDGPGIPIDRLHRAVLEQGWTTAGSLGYGFFMMLQSADRVYLLTQENVGTTVVIEKNRVPGTLK